MVTVPLFLMVMALIFAVLAACNAPSTPRLNWLGLAFACFVASFLFRSAL